MGLILLRLMLLQHYRDRHQKVLVHFGVSVLMKTVLKMMLCIQGYVYKKVVLDLLHFPENKFCLGTHCCGAIPAEVGYL